MIMLIAGNAIAAGHGAQADFWTPQAPNRSTRWIERTITLHGPLDDDRRAKLAEIAEKTRHQGGAGRDPHDDPADLSPGDHSPQNRPPTRRRWFDRPERGRRPAQTAAGEHRGITSCAAAPAGVAGVVRSTDREDP
jgi:hypothetical protein